MKPDEAKPGVVSFWDAFRFWLKLGFISFGGPTGQIAIMHQELVERRRWISEKRFLHALNYCMVLPGPEAQQLATYIGWLMHRTWGGIVAGGLFVLPSVFILISLSWIYVTWGSVPLIAGIFYGIKPAVVAIVLAAAWRIGQRALKHPALWGVSAAAFVAILVFQAPFPAIVMAAGVIGYAGGQLAPHIFTGGGGHGSGQKGYGPAVIDDDTPAPAHALFSWTKFWAYLGAGLALWGGALGALALVGGWDGTLTQMGWFFSKAAMLTFGGAYAVLPYVFQGAVEHHGWLTAPQMIDGLALGETTPGPLIMVVAFVGFLGAGVAGALVATYFTFLPSFVFIFAGAPFVETTHGNLKFSAPLTGITAAVVGVIVNLALFFAWHVLWPKGWEGGFDWPSALIGAAAFIALFRYKTGIMPVIGACALAGLAVTFVARLA
ncbi:MAG: chromate efflux transporter [Proteobacteria bacterium]|nr:chromate efflux transporter [Pseudomonadota bacterium]